MRAILVALVLMIAPPALAKPWPSHRQMKKCFVYLPAMQDAKLRNWCMKLSKRLP